MEQKDKDKVKQLLKDYYHLDGIAIPAPQQRANFTNENKLGFFLGIAELHTLLTGNSFETQQRFSTEAQLKNPKYADSFIDTMFEYYIGPFHSKYNFTCDTVSGPSQKNTDDDAFVPADSHEQFKLDLKARDGCCVFCWSKLLLHTAHIIAQKNLPFAFEQSSILSRAGLEHMHQVQNGLLLCSGCHGGFDTLERYVDIVDNKMVVKIVNPTDDVTSEKHAVWEATVKTVFENRRTWGKFWMDGRKAIEYETAVPSEFLMALYFAPLDPREQSDEEAVKRQKAKQPNRSALEFHKAACLIWKMAGGAEPRDYECCDDDEMFDPMRATYWDNVTDWASTQQIEYSNVKNPNRANFTM